MKKGEYALMVYNEKAAEKAELLMRYKQELRNIAAEAGLDVDDSKIIQKIVCLILDIDTDEVIEVLTKKEIIKTLSLSEDVADRVINLLQIYGYVQLPKIIKNNNYIIKQNSKIIVTQKYIYMFFQTLGGWRLL